jgi:hypothetical protein
MKRNRSKTLANMALGMVSALAAAGCDDGGEARHDLPWEAPRTQIIAGGRAALEAGAPEGDDCIEYRDECIKPQDRCGDGVSSDVIVDDEGRVLTIVCYPPGDALSVEEVEAQDGDIRQNQNNAVIHLDELDDDVDLDGNLSIDANNVIVYGHGADVSLIGGNVVIDGNNIIVHGVRIQGDVEVLFNNVFFVNSVIEGNLTLHGNNAVVTSCDVLGTTTVLGNNAELTANHLVGALSVSGKNALCEENFAADDADADGVIGEAEVGAALSCGG